MAEEGKDWVWDRFVKSSNGLRERIEALTEEEKETVRRLVYERIDKIGIEIEGGGRGTKTQGYKFPVSCYLVTGVRCNVEVVATDKFTVLGATGVAEWVRCEEDVKGRVLHPSFVCYLVTDGILGNVMTR